MARTAKRDVALGFRVHTAWSTAVVLSGPSEAPALLERRRVETWDRKVPSSRQPYHVGLNETGPAAEQAVRRAADAARVAALRAVCELAEELAAAGSPVRSIGLVVGSDGDPARLGNPHVRAHALEGRLFREAIEAAAGELRVPAHVLVAKDAWRQAGEALARSEAELKSVTAALGRSAGKPWRVEEKLAVLAAWVGLGDLA